MTEKDKKIYHEILRDWVAETGLSLPLATTLWMLRQMEKTNLGFNLDVASQALEQLSNHALSLRTKFQEASQEKVDSTT